MASPSSVKIFHEEVLGVGSYGKVCKATYGRIPCAAKLLHEIFFQDIESGRSVFLEKFEKECGLLCMFRHPNIIQYLGTTREPQTALLMEIMDESLTKFLERSKKPLPYHIQLNICHDVALALSHLHSHEIIHRDLSSNNVLLIGEGSRAKITDFGMSKLIDENPSMTPLTFCPGTSVYMPPEALRTPPNYTTKLDCFSYGVLTIQIVAKRFPKPSGPTASFQDSRSPTGHYVFFVPELDRRQEDIDLMGRDHPLYPVAYHCIKDSETDRPSADDLCDQLAEMKRGEGYKQSLRQSKGQVKELQQQIQILQSKMAEKDELLTRAQGEITRLQAYISPNQQNELNFGLAQLNIGYEHDLTSVMAQLQT